MTLPLYKREERAGRHTGTVPPSAHAGLWFDKFCDRWDSSWHLSSDQGESTPKLEWIKTVTGSPVGDAEQIDEFVSRQVSLTEKRGGRWFVMRTSSPFVTGLGRSHPVENGFAWHPTLGTPYLPGSSIKGLVHAWAELETEPEHVKRLLGDPGNTGDIAFLDAVPTGPARLEADVMTPHYANWTQEAPPGDWSSPTPIPFLVAAPRSQFLFCFVPCLASSSEDLDAVGTWLRSALAYEGGGAKTAVGYGRFEQDAAGEAEVKQKQSRREKKARGEREARIEVQERNRRLAELGALEREIEEILSNRKDKGMRAVTAIAKEVESGRWSGDDKIEAANWLKTRMEEENRWKEISRRKSPAKDRDYQNTLRVKSWLSGS